MQAIDWVAAHSPSDIMHTRERMISQIEIASAKLKECGWHAEWFDGADETIKRISYGCNGHLFSQLLRALGYVDSDCVELLRYGLCVRAGWGTQRSRVVVGAAVLGDLDCSGIGTPMHMEGEWIGLCGIEALRAQNYDSNVKVTRNLREGDYGKALHEATVKDAHLGRMSEPRPLGEQVPTDVRLQPRFGVPQCRPDGSVKLRAVDHFSWAATRKRLRDSVNGCTRPAEKMGHDTLDVLAGIMKRMQNVGHFIPGLWKADVDAAFRRIPVRPSQRWACGVVYVVDGMVFFICKRCFSRLFLCCRSCGHAITLVRSAPWRPCMRGSE